MGKAILIIVGHQTDERAESDVGLYFPGRTD